MLGDTAMTKGYNIMYILFFPHIQGNTDMYVHALAPTLMQLAYTMVSQLLTVFGVIKDN